MYYSGRETSTCTYMEPQSTCNKPIPGAQVASRAEELIMYLWSILKNILFKFLTFYLRLRFYNYICFTMQEIHNTHSPFNQADPNHWHRTCTALLLATINSICMARPKHFKCLTKKIRRRKIITTRLENREGWLKFTTLPG